MDGLVPSSLQAGAPATIGTASAVTTPESVVVPEDFQKRRTSRSNAGKNLQRDSLLAIELAAAQQTARKRPPRTTIAKKRPPRTPAFQRRLKVQRLLGLLRPAGSPFTWTPLDGAWYGLPG